MTKTITTSRYPLLSMQFSPKFATHEDNGDIPVGAYMISQDPKVPGCQEHSDAIASVLASLHPEFPVA